MKNVVTNFLMVLLVGLFVFSCSKEDTNDLASGDNNITTDISERCDETLTIEFLAGQFIDSGDVTITQERDTMVSVLITMQNGYSLNKYHIYFGADQELPRTKRTGNPKIGQFNYKSGNLGGVVTAEARIPIELTGARPITIAVHGEVTGPTNETAWGQGVPITVGGSWAMMNPFLLDKCTGNPNGLCDGFQTLTQDQWGDPNSLGGMILTDEFATLAGLASIIEVGCSDSLTYTNPASLLSYLPDNSPIVTVNVSLVDNTAPISKTAGELIALRLNLAADANISTFSTAQSSLGDQQYIEFNNYFGLTVNQVLLDGQKVLTGCLTNNIVELTGAVVAINGAYANGNDGSGILFCPFDN